MNLCRYPASTCVVNSFDAVVRLTAAPLLEARRNYRPPNRRKAGELLDFDFRSGLFELLLDGRRLVLVNAFLDGLGRAVNQILGFFQPQAGDFANRLDDVDLVSAHVGENNGELRFLFCGSRSRSSATA